MTPLAKLRLAVSVKGKVAFDSTDAAWLLQHIEELEHALSAPIAPPRPPTTEEIAKRVVLLRLAPTDGGKPGGAA